MTDANRERMTADEAHELAGDTRMMIDYDLRHITQDLNNQSTRAQLLNLISRQQELLDYALAEIGRLRAANDAREGDGR